MPLNSKTTNAGFKDVLPLAGTIISAAFWQILGGCNQFYPGCTVMAAMFAKKILGASGQAAENCAMMDSTLRKILGANGSISQERKQELRHKCENAKVAVYKKFLEEDGAASNANYTYDKDSGRHFLFSNGTSYDQRQMILLAEGRKEDGYRKADLDHKNSLVDYGLEYGRGFYKGNNWIY